MNLSVKVLIVGYGHMGKTYEKVLQSMGIACDWRDPLLEEKTTDWDSFTHCLILTPPRTHMAVYEEVSAYFTDDHILIIKPVVNRTEDLWLLDKPIFCGMVNRYPFRDYVLPYITETANKISCHRLNNSKVDDDYLTDLGIHDIDSIFHFLNFQELPFYYPCLWHDMTYLTFYQGKKEFYCPEIMGKPPEQIAREFSIYCSNTIDTQNRRISTVIQDGMKTITIDYEERFVKIVEGLQTHFIHLPREYNPFVLQMEDFLAGKPCNAKLAHQFVLSIQVNPARMERRINGI